jgi:uncharacterized membrane protein YcfT
MYQIVHNLALGATLIALVASLWQDWGTFTTIKRMLISYLGFFFLGALMTLAVKLVGAFENNPADVHEDVRQDSRNKNKT